MFDATRLFFNGIRIWEFNDFGYCHRFVINSTALALANVSQIIPIGIKRIAIASNEVLKMPIFAPANFRVCGFG